MNTPITPAAARQLILSHAAPEGLHVSGHLDLSGSAVLRQLPNNLRCSSLNISDCPDLLELPLGLVCNQLEARNLHLVAVPELFVRFRLDLSGCEELLHLPKNLTVGSLLLRECLSLERLPEGINTSFLDLTGCTNLTGFPKTGTIGIGHVLLRGCVRLTALPEWLGNLAQLDLAGCEQLTHLPQGLCISSWLDVADTGLQTVPAKTQLRWRGVAIEPRIAFDPESIHAKEVLEEQNLELRRVKLERMGYEKFMTQANAQLLHHDTDPGGVRKLLRVALAGDEDLVALWVICPSTGRNYVLRVPPSTKTCHQAAAWLAGFDNPADYAPLVEA
jgi:hypothetical protein